MSQPQGFYRFTGTDGYIASDSLVDAVNCAIALERWSAPLLVPYLLVLVGLLSLSKVVFYAASVGLFGFVRVVLACWPGSRIGKVGRSTAPPQQ